MPPPPLRRYGRGVARTTVCEGVSSCRFLVAPMFWILHQVTHLPLGEMNFLIKHRREVTINAPPAPEAMRPQRVAGYCQRSPTKSSFVFELCSLASLSLFMFHVFSPFGGFSPPPPDTSVNEAARTAVGGRLADEAARTTASVAVMERATQDVRGAGRGRAGGRGRGVHSGVASGGQAGGEE